jgi:hypothetical protein
MLRAMVLQRGGEGLFEDMPSRQKADG